MASRTLGVGVIGAGWLGDVHARAWGRLRHHYPDLGVEPRFVAVADSSSGALDAAVAKHGFSTAYLDWRDLVGDPTVDVVSVTAPNTLHREIGVAVAGAGKHLWIEKPVGLCATDARAVADAIAVAGVQATVGFNYRAVPAVAQLRRLVADGAIGTPTHARFAFLSDYAAHPLGLHTWRFGIALGGHGVLGDLASHAVDLARFVLGPIDRLVAETAILISERPLPARGSVAYGHGIGRSGDTSALVENEDYVMAMARTSSGALVSIECSRVATGEQNAYDIEVHGTRGLVAWTFRRPGELRVSSGDAYLDQPTQQVFVGSSAGDYGRFQPGSALPMSFDDTKVIELSGLIRAIVTGRNVGPGLIDAVASAEALEAMIASAAGGGWVVVPTR